MRGFEQKQQCPAWGLGIVSPPCDKHGMKGKLHDGF